MMKAVLAFALALAILGSGMALKADNGAAQKPTSEQPQPIVNIDQQAEIRSIIARINESVVARHIQALQDYQTRYSYSPYCRDSAEYIYSIFARYNLNTEYNEYRMGHMLERNVIGTLHGTDTGSTAVYIICAHYDSFSEMSYFLAPGADDNGSGTAAVLAAAEVLSQYRFNNTIRFVAFSGEEQWTKGSNDYAARQYTLGTNISGVLNLDMVGWNGPLNTTLLRARTNVLSEGLVNFTDFVANKYQDIIGLQIYKKFDNSTNSDHAPFWLYGWKAIHLIEDRYDVYPGYHKTTDTISILNLSYAANSTQLAVATIAELAGLNGTDLTPPVCSAQRPSENGWCDEIPEISFNITDSSLVNSSGIGLWVDGAPLAFTLSYAPLGWNVIAHPGSFPDGSLLTVRVMANDSCGNLLDHTWNFTVDAVPPLPPSDVTISLRATVAEKQGLVLNIGANGTYDGAYDGLHTFKPSVIYHEGEYKMWYTGDDGVRERVLYANSSDGISWTKQGLAVNVGSSGENDSAHAAYCTVIWDGEYKMWYSGSNGTTWRIMYANSTNGTSWTKQGMVMDIGANGSVDSIWAYSPCVILDGSVYKMWYTSWDGNRFRLSYAESADGLSWNKRGVVLDTSAQGGLDCQVAAEPSVLKDGSQYLLWYTGFNGYRYRVLEANSSDGMNWTRQGVCVGTGQTGEYDSSYATCPGTIMVGGYPWIYYSGLSGSNYRILRATRNASTQRSNVVVAWNASISLDVVKYNVRFSSNWSVFSSGGGEFVSATLGLALADAGDGNATSLYAKISAIDKVGHATENWTILGKAGFSFQAGWGLVGDPFSTGAPLDEFLSTVGWDYAMSYAGGDPANPWHTNYTDRLDALNDLSWIGECQGVWARTVSNETYAAAGRVANHSVTLYAGWNHAAMPYARSMAASEVKGIVGASFIEGFDQAGTYKTKVLADGDLMYPGQSYWIYMGSGTTWNVDNY